MANVFNFKNLVGKVNRLLINQQLLLEYLLVFLLIDYALLFSAESIIPGLVMRFFNLNFFLIFVLLLWLLLNFVGKRPESNSQKLFDFVVSVSLVTFGVTLVFTFIGNGLLESITYSIFILVTGKLLIDQLSQ